MQLNLNQPLRGTTRSHLTGKPAGVQGSAGYGSKSIKSVDVLAARVTALFAPYIRDISDSEFILLSEKLAKLLTPASGSPFVRGGKS